MMPLITLSVLVSLASPEHIIYVHQHHTNLLNPSNNNILIILKCAARRIAQPPRPASEVLHQGGAKTPSLIKKYF